MKKYILIFILSLSISSLFSQTFEMRTYLDETDYIFVQLRQTALGSQPDPLGTSDGISDLVFTLRWLQSVGDVDVDLICDASHNDWHIAESGTRTSKESYYYQQFGANVAFACPQDFTLNDWVTIAKIKTTISSGSASGTFELAPDGWAGNLLVTIDWNQAGSSTQYFPTLVTGNCDNTPVPTIVYNYVWKGGSAPPPNFKKWNVSGNWTDECGDGVASYPWGGGSENVYIPGGLTYYPEQTSGGDDYAFICNYLLIGNGGHITVPDLSAQSTNTYFSIQNDASIKGKLYLPALGYATVGGSTEIDNAEGVEVQADATGVGSFIDNGTITYGTGGTGKAQTYLTNGAGAGSFYMHLVGPTLDDENYTGSGTGAFLGAFNVANGSTYAYTYDQGTGNWDNINSTTYEVHTADGIGLSTTDATAYTMSMSGEFITGNVTHSVGFGGTNNELISNPYPSAIDADAFATDGSNSGVIANKNWLWDPSSGNYLARSNGSGGQQYIQVGQAFFVETTAAGSVTFKNSFRSHSNDAFRDVNPNELTMTVSGGDYGFKDELVVRFVEDATYGYDPEIDAYKINSMYEDATQIESIAEDGSELSINFLPVAGLSGDMVSVPVNFQCGYSGEYTFDFEGIETFEDQNEIWLEDKKDNNNWIYLNNNPHYTFTAVPYEPHDRFILHFFGPTGIDENSVDNPVDIYSYRQYVYIKKNEPNEVIKKVSVYNINGEELFSKRVPDQPVNKLWVSEQVGYYLVRVITDKNSYTGKVFIFK